MKQDDAWQMHYEEVMNYMETYHRCPSKHRIEDHLMLNWIKYNKKLLRKGVLPIERMERFNQLLAVAAKYRRLNQYA